MGLIEQAIALANHNDWYVQVGPRSRLFGAPVAIRTGDAAREEEAWFLKEMYAGRQEQFIDRYPEETVEEFARRWKASLNLTRPIIDILSGLYKDAPRRIINSDFPHIEQRLARVWRTNALDATMQTVDRMTRLTGTVALRPSYDRESGRVTFWLFTPDKIRVIENPDDPRHPGAVILRWTARNPEHPQRLTRIAHIWTRDEFARVVNGGEVKSERRKHGMGVIPVVFFHDRVDFDDFFTHGRGRDTALVNCVINNKLTHKLETIIYQGLGIPVIKNPTPGRELVFSPKRAITIDVPPGTEAGLEFVSPDAPIADLLADVEADIEHLLLANRIPESAIRIKAAAHSGVAIIAENIPIIEDRKERMRLFAPAERELIDVTLRVLNEFEEDFHFDPEAHRYDFRIDYPEPRFPLNVQEQIARDEFMLGKGLITPWQIWMREDPDRFATEDDAKQKWQEQAKEYMPSNGNAEISSDSMKE